MTLSDSLELYVCIILSVEFVYDYWYNSVENRRKRRAKAIKPKKAEEIIPYEKEMD